MDIKSKDQLVRSYNSLVHKLNDSIRDASWDPEIIIDPDNIRRELEVLKTSIESIIDPKPHLFDLNPTVSDLEEE